MMHLILSMDSYFDNDNLESHTLYMQHTMMTFWAAHSPTFCQCVLAAVRKGIILMLAYTYPFAFLGLALVPCMG